ncbi:MAG: hypothetical protein HYZ08_01320 [Candidatus Kerfeldbacteria bacterium]|nr:hypothetical protein [Candidatus Kerfeldbacteria bacterium]
MFDRPIVECADVAMIKGDVSKFAGDDSYRMALVRHLKDCLGCRMNYGARRRVELVVPILFAVR